MYNQIKKLQISKICKSVGVVEKDIRTCDDKWKLSSGVFCISLLSKVKKSKDGWYHVVCFIARGDLFPVLLLWLDTVSCFNRIWLKTIWIILTFESFFSILLLAAFLERKKNKISQNGIEDEWRNISVLTDSSAWRRESYRLDYD